MTRSERLLEILQHLREMRFPVTARALGERFKVSERTIYRDVETLGSRGAVISGAPGVGYVLREGFFLPPLAFDAQEAAALMLGLRFVLRRGDAAMIAGAASARAKLEAVAPDAFSSIRSIGEPLLVGPAAHPVGDHLALARDALARERKLAISYADRAGAVTIRTIWPIAIGWFDDVEMIAAWCETREAFRHFRVDRLQTIRLVDERPAVGRARLLADYRALEPDIVM